MLGYSKETQFIVIVMVKNNSFYFFNQMYLILALLNWAAQMITNTMKKNV